jgi:hypothetical protein
MASWCKPQPALTSFRRCNRRTREHRMTIDRHRNKGDDMPKRVTTAEVMSDPRMRNLVAGRTPYEQFMLAAQVSNMEPEQAKALLDFVRPAGIDYTREVGGRALSWWLGKSRDQIAREVPADKLDSLIGDLTEAGINVPDTLPERTAADIAEDRSRSNVIIPRRPMPRDEGAELPKRSADSEDDDPPVLDETFGENQTPFSQLRGKTEQELRDAGIGTAGIRRIRELEVQAMEREDQASRLERARAAEDEAERLAAENPANPAAAAVVGAPAPAPGTIAAPTADAPATRGRSRATTTRAAPVPPADTGTGGGDGGETPKP